MLVNPAGFKNFASVIWPSCSDSFCPATDTLTVPSDPMFTCVASDGIVISGSSG